LTALSRWRDIAVIKTVVHEGGVGGNANDFARQRPSRPARRTITPLQAVLTAALRSARFTASAAPSAFVP